jgi:bifunctional non-homologous end joining protein LigD
MLPLTINPMLAAKAEVPFDSEQHLFEIKWDGIRCLAFIEAGRVRLQSRQLTEITLQFPELSDLGWLPSGTVLDGELVVFQDDKPSLAAIQHRALLQNSARIQYLSQSMPASYMVFDLLFVAGKPLMAAPLRVRREALAELNQQFLLPGFLLSDGLSRCGCKLFAQIVRLGLEGMMAKRLDSPYLPGKRSRHWLKIKPALTRLVGPTTRFTAFNL